MLNVSRKAVLLTLSHKLKKCLKVFYSSSSLPSQKIFNESLRAPKEDSRIDKNFLKINQNLPLNISPKMDKIGHEAEKFLGTSKFSMNSSLSQVLGNYTEIIKLFSMKNSVPHHPLLYLTNLLEAEEKYKKLGDSNPYPLWRAMMVFLSTEIFGTGKEIGNINNDNQLILKDRLDRMGKIVEITFLTEQIHKRIIDVDLNLNPHLNVSGSEMRKYSEELHDANKTATLIGDLLWAQTCSHMAALKCQKVSELICAFLMDYCESEFLVNHTTSPSSFTLQNWVKKTELGVGSILGTTTDGMLLFNGHDEEMRKIGKKLGILLGLTYQTYEDISYFNKKELGTPFWLDIGFLPVVLKISKQPEVLELPFSQIFDSVKYDEDVFKESKNILKKSQDETLDYLDSIKHLTSSPHASDILKSFILSLSPQ